MKEHRRGMSARGGGALLCLTFLLAGCDDLGPGPGPLRDLEENRARWVGLDMDDYEYVVARRCFCPPAWLGPVRVRVVDGVVESRTYVESSDSVPGQIADAFPRVEGIFDALADAYARDAFRVDVTYDPGTGVPVDVFIDYQQNVADEELGYEVDSVPTPIS